MGKFSNLFEATQYLYALRRVGIKLDMGPVIWGLASMGNPQEEYNAIQVAGTNGKGSTCAIMEAILRSHGLRTGLFTSPHLVRFSERIQVDCQEIPQQAFISLLERVMESNPSFSFFETATAMALLHFASEKVQCAVMETGLGGRLDATGVVRPQVTVITSIGLDHGLALSQSLRRVAWEKAGIMRPGVPCVVPQLSRPIDHVLEQSALSRGTKLIKEGTHFFFSPLPSGTIRFQFGSDTPIVVPQPLFGTVQGQNLALALAAVRLYLDHPLDETIVAGALSALSWPGRLGKVHGFYLDGSHNPPAARVLAEALAAMDPPWDTLCVGMNADKDVESFLRPLIPLFRQIIPLPVDSDRALPPEDLGRIIRRLGGKTLAPPDSLSLDFFQSIPGHKILFTGSFYLVGEVQKLLNAERGDAFPLTDPAQ
ncbi:bifunctional folylpolyglutamate synthase/dihydrofolate synthase [Myxococcota bacterium]|nr:bifunctional folylpolyglutamate synthase/dihydrofolate synthase [Myxococcota bacterium]MBU1537787.1 bifunctional folylpolyglutamate synthase/dihydrofolate synthase [Myxococcota bacterium]